MSPRTKIRFSASEKKRVTADWHTAFPNFAVYKPTWLLRRCGPILVGVLLEGRTGEAEYSATSHTHCLCRARDVVTLTLARQLRTERTRADEYIPLSFHPDRWREAAARLAAQTRLLSVSLTVDDVVRAYDEGLAEPLYRHAVQLIVDPACVMAVTRGELAARRFLDDALARASSWPAFAFEREGGFEKWAEHTRKLAVDVDGLKSTVESQLQALRLESIPNTPLA